VIEERRRRDHFLDLQHDDVLWANMICSHEDLLALDRNRLNDEVLYDLLKMGVLDWEAPNERLNQTIQAMRHSTTMNMRMLAKHLDLEAKVRVTFSCF